MPPQWNNRRRNHSNHSHLPKHADWEIELSLFERNDIASVLSDNPVGIHVSDSSRMTTRVDTGGDSNSSVDIAAINGYRYGYIHNVTELNNSLINASAVINETEPYLNPPLNMQDYILIVLYTATTMLAILGNSLAIVIFTKGKRSKTDLRPFLINLAVADLIMAIFCIPFTFTYQLLGDWIFSPPMCPIVMFLQTLSVTGSVYTNMAIGIDRFGAIAFPLNTSRNNPFRYRVIISIIWVIAASFAGVNLFVGDTENHSFPSRIECKENWDASVALIYTILLLFLTYLIPVFILTVTYSIVGYLLWKRHLPGNADIQRDQVQVKSKLKLILLEVWGADPMSISRNDVFKKQTKKGLQMKIVKMLVTIVVLFALCWLPLHTFFLVLNFSTIQHDQETLSLTYFICHWIAMSNSFVNPIVYGFLNDSFRADCKTLLYHICHPVSHTRSSQRHGAVKFRSRSGQYTVNYSSPYHSEKYTNKAYLAVKYGEQPDRIFRNGSGSSSTSFSRAETCNTSLLRSATK